MVKLIDLLNKEKEGGVLQQRPVNSKTWWNDVHRDRNNELIINTEKFEYRVQPVPDTYLVRCLMTGVYDFEVKTYSVQQARDIINNRPLDKALIKPVKFTLTSIGNSSYAKLKESGNGR